MAEYILKSRNLPLEVSSAGIYARDGEPMATMAQSVVFNELSIFTQHRSRQLIKEMADMNDLILTMTRAQKEILKESGVKNVFTLKEFAGETGDVEDPFGSGYATYLKIFYELKRLIEKSEKKFNNNKGKNQE